MKRIKSIIWCTLAQTQDGHKDMNDKVFYINKGSEHFHIFQTKHHFLNAAYF